MPQKRRPQRHDQILSAAVELFYAKGFHQASVEEIASAVGITAGAIYQHFDGKRALLDTAVEGFAQRQLATTRHLAESIEDPQRRLRALVADLVSTVLADPALAFVARYERAAAGEPVQSSADRSDRLVVAEWLHAVRTARPDCSEADALAMVHAARGAVYSVLHTAQVLPPDELTKLLTGAVMAALSAASGEQNGDGHRPEDPA